MEDTLRADGETFLEITACLNPCFNGRYSQRGSLSLNQTDVLVLILVLMEDTLREIAPIKKKNL